MEDTVTHTACSQAYLSDLDKKISFNLSHNRHSYVSRQQAKKVKVKF